MRLRHIEVFHAIMQAGTISGAALLLHISQPAVTKVLQHCELQLGMPLFDRVRGKLYPTPEAQRLFRLRVEPAGAGSAGRVEVPPDALLPEAGTGELRPVAHGALRLKEAGKLGFERAMVPIALAKDDSALRLTGFRTLGQFVDHMLGRG